MPWPRIHRIADAIVVTIVTLTLGFVTTAHAREQDVEEYVRKGLANYVATTLTEHPRFKNASVRFVVMDNGSPQSKADELSLRLRDRLQRRVIDTAGVNVAWQPGRGEGQAQLPQTAADCSDGDVQYLIGLELAANDGENALLSVRALDVIERTWVSGFSREWRGRLNREQRRASQRTVLDRSFLGDRGVPYDRDETDLMAAHLAHDLRCKLMRRVSGEYVVELGESEGDELTGILDLVSNNVAGTSALQFTTDAGRANATLRSRIHGVDGDLHQLWITLTPTDAALELQPISASIYVKLPEQYLSAAPVPAPQIGTNGVIDSLALVRLGSDRSCATRMSTRARDSYGKRRSECMALRLETREDAVVFVLNHQHGNGLVRLDGGSCSHRTAARIARANEAMTIALPNDLLSDSWRPESEWRLEPDADIYYAIAVSDSKAARALATYLDELPRRCSASVRIGYEGRDLERWLTAFSAAAERWEPHVDWNAIKIRNVY